MLCPSEVALVLVASTNEHLGSLQAAVLDVLEEVGDFVILRWFTEHTIGVLLLVKDVMGSDMSSHIMEKEGEVLLSHVHCVADGIANCTRDFRTSFSFGLFQQQEGFTTILVVQSIELLAELPAITTSCQAL